MNISKIAHVQDPDRRKLIMVLLQEYQDSGGNLYKLERLINKIIEKEDKK